MESISRDLWGQVNWFARQGEKDSRMTSLLVSNGSTHLLLDLFSIHLSNLNLISPILPQSTDKEDEDDDGDEDDHYYYY